MKSDVIVLGVPFLVEEGEGEMKEGEMKEGMKEAVGRQACQHRLEMDRRGNQDFPCMHEFQE